MPWSEWIQPADVGVLPFRRMIAAGDDLASGIVDAIDDAEFWIGSGLDWNAVQFRAGFPNRGALPYPLFMLDEGVDYAAIPGSDPGDPYRFVDYEDVTETWLSWTWDNGYPEVLLTLNSPLSGTLSIVTPTDFDDVDTMPGTPGLQGGGIFSKPTGGTVFDTFTGSESVGHVFGDPGDPGGVEAFTIVAEYDVTEPDDDRVYFTFPDPVAHYRPARYRYWIPSLAPLRLMQRGDNLGMGSGRLFGPGTRQGSGRIFGSL